VFKHWIDEICVTIALGREGKVAYIMIGEFSIHSAASCCDLIKGCETEVDDMLGFYTSKVHVMDVGVNKPFTCCSYMRQAYKCFMIGNTNNREVR
jgi:hypothetical protein